MDNYIKITVADCDEYCEPDISTNGPYSLTEIVEGLTRAQLDDLGLVNLSDPATMSKSNLDYLREKYGWVHIDALRDKEDRKVLKNSYISKQGPYGGTKVVTLDKLKLKDIGYVKDFKLYQEVSLKEVAPVVYAKIKKLEKEAKVASEKRKAKSAQKRLDDAKKIVEEASKK